MEQGQHGEGLFAVRGRDLINLHALRDHIMVCNHHLTLSLRLYLGQRTYSFRQPGRPTTEAQEPTDIPVRLACWDLERRSLSTGSVASAEINQLLDSRIPLLLALKQKDTVSGNPRILRRRHRNTHRRRHRHQKLGPARLQRVGHFLDIVSGRSARDHAA